MVRRLGPQDCLPDQCTRQQEQIRGGQADVVWLGGRAHYAPSFGLFARECRWNQCQTLKKNHVSKIVGRSRRCKNVLE